jgi:transcriptional regulator with XRE-family HTH domain
METLGSRIKHWRIQKGLSQRQLADLINAKHNSVSDWENDKNKPYADTLELLLGVFGIDANTLLGWDNPEQLRTDAEALAAEILSNPKIKKILPVIKNLSEEDLNFAIDFLKRLSSK